MPQTKNLKSSTPLPSIPSNLNRRTSSSVGLFGWPALRMPAAGVDLKLTPRIRGFMVELVTPGLQVELMAAGRRDDKVDPLALGLLVPERSSTEFLTDDVVAADLFLAAALVPSYLCLDAVLFLATADVVVTAVLVARLTDMEAALRDKENFVALGLVGAVLFIMVGGRETSRVTGNTRDV